MEEFVGADDHLADHLFADGRLLGDDIGIYFEQLYLDFIGVADEAAFIIVGTAWHGGDDAGYAACCTTLGCGEGFVVAPHHFVDFLADKFEI